MLPWQPSRSTSDVKVGAERERESDHTEAVSPPDGRGVQGASDPPGAIIGTGVTSERADAHQLVQQTEDKSTLFDIYSNALLSLYIRRGRVLCVFKNISACCTGSGLRGPVFRLLKKWPITGLFEETCPLPPDSVVDDPAAKSCSSNMTNMSFIVFIYLLQYLTLRCSIAWTVAVNSHSVRCPLKGNLVAADTFDITLKQHNTDDKELKMSKSELQGTGI